MIGLVLLVVTAIVAGVAALSVLGHPGWLWQILANVSVLNAMAALVVVLRRPWGRRVASVLLGAQVAGAVAGLVIVGFVEVRELPRLDMAVTLLAFIFVPVVAAIAGVSLLAAWSIRRLEWPGR